MLRRVSPRGTRTVLWGGPARARHDGCVGPLLACLLVEHHQVGEGLRRTIKPASQSVNQTVESERDDTTHTLSAQTPLRTTTDEGQATHSDRGSTAVLITFSAVQQPTARHPDSTTSRRHDIQTAFRRGTTAGVRQFSSLREPLDSFHLYANYCRCQTVFISTRTTAGVRQFPSLRGPAPDGAGPCHLIQAAHVIHHLVEGLARSRRVRVRRVRMRG